MDPYSGAAYGRIWLFSADLNLVLGTSLCASPYGVLGASQHSFNHIGLPPQCNRGGFQQPLPWNQTTKRSRAWKMNTRGSQSARCPPYIASRKEYVPHRPKSRVPHQSTSQQTISNNIWLDHLQPKNSLQNTSPVLPERDICSHDCQQNNDHNQSPLEAPENEDTDGESKNGTKIQNDSTDYPASPADTIKALRETESQTSSTWKDEFHQTDT
ncbi:hypothetical protein PCASD_06273 [Puccinia coronata f. sp. avenae]|uniref:Uncharacterized protein n=1 Tax=Puccinia coronata f. sp. avenae TaxID=200324 RepID=A0A2N5V6F8_9BASI|nr:hypothetical protein PCASD_06273 [Puccinia coronata f. sp. avenae]